MSSISVPFTGKPVVAFWSHGFLRGEQKLVCPGRKMLLWPVFFFSSLTVVAGGAHSGKTQPFSQFGVKPSVFFLVSCVVIRVYLHVNNSTS